MSIASLRNDTQNLGVLAPERKRHATVCVFGRLRHPTALATAFAQLQTFPLTGLERQLAELLVMHADREGLYWGQITGELLALMRPRQSLRDNQVQAFRKRLSVTARTLRRLGILTWRKVPPFSRYPRRVSYHEPAQWGRGEYTISGGRVWLVRWENLGVTFARPTLARNKQRGIQADPSRGIQADPSSDPSGSPLENLTGDPALAEDDERRAASPPRERDREDRGDRAVASLPPLPEKMASETPCAADAARASPPNPTPTREPESVQGVRSPRSRPHVPPERMPEWLQAGARMGEASPARPATADGPKPDE